MRATIAAGPRRIEMHVARGFGAGARLAFVLGFEVEGLMPKFAPDGTDYFLFAKVR